MRRESPGAAGEEERRLVLSGVLICLSELFERVTYYGIMANMAQYVTSPCFPKYYGVNQPLIISWIFMAIAYTCTIFGGCLADIFNRFRIILISLCIYLIGTIFLVVSAELCGQSPHEHVFGLYVAGLVVVAIGTGGSKSNLGLFGAQQCTSSDGDLQVKLQQFFHWYYFAINVGVVIAVVGVTRLQDINPIYGNVVITVSIVLSAIVFVVGRFCKLYVLQQDSPRDQLMRTTAAMLSKKGTSEQQEASQQSKEVYSTAKTVHLVMIFATLIPYYAVYSQTQTTYLLQSERLRMPTGMDATDFTAINSVTVLVMIVIMVRGVYPYLRDKGVKLPLMTLMWVGMFLSAFSALAAGIVENNRRPLVQNGHFVDQVIGNQTVRAADLSVFVQVPQLVLSGISEVLTLTVGYHFAYVAAPPNRKGIFMGAYLLTWGLGSALSLGLSELVDVICVRVRGSACVPTDLNEGQAEWYFIVLEIFLLLTCVIYYYLKQLYKSDLEDMNNTPTEDEQHVIDSAVSLMTG